MFSIGLAFFTGPLLIILSLKCGNPTSAASGKPVSGKPKAKPAKPAVKSKPAPKKASSKPTGGSQSESDLTIIYVGNLSPEANETVLQTAFSGFGEIKKIKIIKDRGRPKGFGFVEMYGREQALKAIETLNGEELAGRELKVNEAKPKTKGRPQRPQRSQKPQDTFDDEPMRPNIFE
ncbi:MAG: RNA-binding protein [Phycisphaerae bacterium]|nr:RNA-binding protein [Phycisphaerae bacterium]